MDYFTMNNEKIFIEIKASRVIFKKYMNGILTQLNDEQSKKIIDKLKISDGYNYWSQMLIELMHANPSLNSNFEYYYPFFDYIEKLIPEKFRSSFYKNLRTLQIELNLNVDIKNEDLEKGYMTCGGYNLKDNKITMNPKSINQIREASMLTNDPNAFFLKHFAKDLLHEIFHMASSNYDKETKISLCGFNKYPSDDICDSNRGLTEGMTEVLACCGVPETIEIACAYYIEELFIIQLTQIIGSQPLLDSYFGNLGTELLCEKLCEINNDKNKATSLFVLINMNYSLNEINEEQTILGSIQLKLVDYYSQKILSDIKNGASELEIRKSIEIYKRSLVTNEVLNTMMKNPSNYPNLDASIEAFNNLEIEINNLFKNKSK